MAGKRRRTLKQRLTRFKKSTGKSVARLQRRASRVARKAQKLATKKARKIARAAGLIAPQPRRAGGRGDRPPTPPDFPETPIVVTNANDFARVFKDIETRRYKRLDHAVVVAAMIATRIIRSTVPIDQGGLRRETKLVYHGKSFGTSGLLCEIVYFQPYAAAQEAGTRPFKPPLRPLFDWAYRQAPNLGLNREDKSEIFAFAKGVQKAIMTHGIRAKWFERDSLPTRRRVLAEVLRTVDAGKRLPVAS